MNPPMVMSARDHGWVARDARSAPTFPRFGPARADRVGRPSNQAPLPPTLTAIKFPLISRANGEAEYLTVTVSSFFSSVSSATTSFIPHLSSSSSSFSFSSPFSPFSSSTLDPHTVVHPPPFPPSGASQSLVLLRASPDLRRVSHWVDTPTRRRTEQQLNPLNSLLQKLLNQHEIGSPPLSGSDDSSRGPRGASARRSPQSLRPQHHPTHSATRCGRR